MPYRPALALFLFIAPLAAQIHAPVHNIEMNGRVVPYVIDGPYAVTEGDIIIGKADEIETFRASRERDKAGPSPQSLSQTFGATGPQLWPNGIIYYTIDPSVTNTQAILAGIAQWNSLTPLQVLPRTNQPDYVHFTAVSIDAACESYIGKIGGSQDIGVTSDCSAGSVAHELGHAFGLLHEQQRADRGGYVTVLYQNIDKRFYGNFYQSPLTSTPAGYYDFGSIMHYPYYGFSTNFQDTLETVPVGIPIGQRNKLSAGDIDGVSRLYSLAPTTTTITTVPEGILITVDGVAATSPISFSWAPGSQHTVAVNGAFGNDPHYVFANWSDGGTATHTLTASADQTVFCANFVVEHLMQTAVLGGTGGSISLLPTPVGGYLPERYPFQLTATASTGFQFVGWTGLGLYSLYNYGVSSSLPSSVSEVYSIPDESLIAAFTSFAVTTVDSQPHGLYVTVDGVQYLTPANFTWGSGTTHRLSASSPQYFGNDTLRFQFLNWDDGSTGLRTVTAGATSATYTATFNTQYLMTTGTLTVGSVAASPNSADGYYDAGTNVQLTATTSPYVLRYWVGDLASNDNPATVVMDQPRVVQANIGPPLAFRVLSAASLTGNPNVGSTGTIVAPGELVAIFGNGIGPSNPTFATLDSSGTFPFSLGGYQVFFDSFPAALVYAGANQINAIVPYGVSGQIQTTVKIQGPSGSQTSTMSVYTTSPGLFTANGYGTGQVSAINQDGSINSPSSPAPRGSVVVLYGTGGGVMDKSFADGIVTAADLGYLQAPVWVRFGKLPGTVYYAGSAPYLVNGVFQINVSIPPDLAAGGQVPLQVIMGTFATPPGTTISVQ
jgi:uncharacterized protein (TIGR03437 family)